MPQRGKSSNSIDWDTMFVHGTGSLDKMYQSTVYGYFTAREFRSHGPPRMAEDGLMVTWSTIPGRRVISHRQC